MSPRNASRLRWFGLIVLGAGAVFVPGRAEAQILGGTNGAGGAGNAYGGTGNYGFPGLGMDGSGANIPRQGSWAEVLSTSSKGWLVLQDAEGRQYPVGVDAIKQFLIRWPTSPDRISPEALVEANGVNLGSNMIGTDHVDVYEQDARGLVSPTVQNIVGLNRVLTPWDVDQINTYGARYFMMPGEQNLPTRVHIVGPLNSLDPFRIAAANNISYAIQPGMGGLSMSRITLGSAELARRGDLVYYVADEAQPKSLIMSLLVLYKKTPAP